MTARLEKAIRQLPPEKLDELAEYAERLAQQQAAPKPQQPQFLKLDWVGAGAHLNPEHRSGVEAAHAAAEMWRKSLDESGRE